MSEHHQPQQGAEESDLSVPRESEIDKIRAISQAVGEEVSLVACNFPEDPVERYSLMSLATDSEAMPVADLLNSEFKLMYWFVHNVAITDHASGEVTKAPRIVLIDDEGNAAYGVSSGLFKALQLLIGAYGSGPLDPPVTIRFTQSKTRQGWRLLSFVPVRK